MSRYYLCLLAKTFLVDQNGPKLLKESIAIKNLISTFFLRWSDFPVFPLRVPRPLRSHKQCCSERKYNTRRGTQIQIQYTTGAYATGGGRTIQMCCIQEPRVGVGQQCGAWPESELRTHVAPRAHPRPTDPSNRSPGRAFALFAFNHVTARGLGKLKMISIPFRAGLELEVRQSFFLLQVGFYWNVQVSDQVQDSMVKSSIPLILLPKQTAM